MSRSTAKIKITGVGSRFSKNESQAGIRIRLYDRQNEEYIYSNTIVQNLEAYSNTTQVKYTYSYIEGNENVTGIQSSILNQLGLLQCRLKVSECITMESLNPFYDAIEEQKNLQRY